MNTGYKELILDSLRMNFFIVLLSGLGQFASTAKLGDLRLVDGPSPNMGRVEMYLGGRGWFTTCDPTWGILDAIVVCRQLGFPGAAFAQASAEYKAIGIPLARSVKCTGYESKLLDCPYHTTELCTSAVGVICQEPGYIGCYVDEPSNSIFRDGKDVSPMMDLATCKAFCRQKGAQYVGLKNHDECYCAKTGALLASHEKLADSACQISCVGNSKEICGGVSTKGKYVVSVHHMYTGECTRLPSPTNGYMLDTEFQYGQDVRFRCNEGFTLDGSDTLRCDLRKGGVGSDGSRVDWNASVPLCVAIPPTPITDHKVWLRTRGTTGNLLADRPGLVLVLSLIVVFALCVPTFVFVVIRRHCARRKMLIDEKTDKHSYQDLLYNRRYELNSTFYEPLRPPRKRDALRAEKTKTAPCYLDIDPYTKWQQQEFGLKSDPIYQCSSSMNDLVIKNVDTRQANNLSNTTTQKFSKKEEDDITGVYSNGNTMNFKKHMSGNSFRNDFVRSSLRKDSINNLRNQELNKSKTYEQEEDDDGDYAVI